MQQLKQAHTPKWAHRSNRADLKKKKKRKQEKNLICSQIKIY